MNLCLNNDFYFSKYKHVLVCAHILYYVRKWLIRMLACCTSMTVPHESVYSLLALYCGQLSLQTTQG